MNCKILITDLKGNLEQFGERLQDADEWNYELNLYLDDLEETVEGLEEQVASMERKVKNAGTSGVIFGSAGGFGLGLTGWGVGELINGNNGLPILTTGVVVSAASYSVWALGRYVFKWW